jgi:predicted phosphodiesterase
MKKNRLEKIFLIPDCHIPYEDKKAFELMLKVLRDFQPDHLIILGDFMDMYSVSSHSKDPNRALKLKEEIDQARFRLKQIADVKIKHKIFIEGNHEDRLSRYLQDKAPELFNLVQIPALLDLDKLGFDFVPYKTSYKLGKLHLTHDCGNAGRFAHYKALDTFQKNVIIGHTHRLGYTVDGNAEGERHLGAMLGWLGDWSKVDYMHRVKVARDWCLGFGIGFIEPKTKCVYITPVPIVENTVCVNGKLFKV